MKTKLKETSMNLDSLTFNLVPTFEAFGLFKSQLLFYDTLYRTNLLPSNTDVKGQLEWDLLSVNNETNVLSMVNLPILGEIRLPVAYVTVVVCLPF